MDKRDLSSCTKEELKKLLAFMGEKPFRANQIYEWIHQKLCTNFNEMTNISATLRQKLGDTCFITEARQVDKQVSAEDGTIKYLFQLPKETIIESVLMRYSFGNSVCISSQAGCRMGCRFCASGAHGLFRDLSAGEMLAQVYAMERMLLKNIDGKKGISNVVLMGSGEPFDNYGNVLRFIEILNSESGLNIGQRHITVSTCGIIDKIYDLAEKKLQITLAVSLHAPNDDIRKKTMPVANKYPMDELLKACRHYSDYTGRRVTYEYALINGVNDALRDASELGKKLKGSLSHVNLIPVNDVSESGFGAPNDQSIEAFAGIIKSYGVEATVRRRLGSSINAACGQLRSKLQS